MRTNLRTFIAVVALLGMIGLSFWGRAKVNQKDKLAPPPPQRPVALRWYKIGELSRTKIVTFRSKIGMGFFVKVAGKKPKFMAAGGTVILHPGAIFVSDPRVAIVRTVLFR